MKITLVGMGMGDAGGLTADARAALGRADAVIGSERLLAMIAAEGLAQGERITEALPAAIARILAEHPGWRGAAVAVAGDVGLYSAATRLRELLPEHEITSCPGIASPQYLAARLGRPWQDFRLVSAHGRRPDVLAEALNHPAVFFLTDPAFTPAGIARELSAAGLGAARLTVGEELGSAAERITTGSAEEMAGRLFHPLSVALVENDKTFARASRVAGIADDAFIRGRSPMTKQFVRAAVLALLAPRETDVLWDIGAGTGSVAVEMALAARRGRVWAVERSPAALRLIEENRLRFGVYTMTAVAGDAPECLSPLPAPDAVFIGGSGGFLADIVAVAREKNPCARLVAAAVTLETLTAAVQLFRSHAGVEPEVRQIAVTRIERRGKSSMFVPGNPVFLIAGGGK